MKRNTRALACTFVILCFSAVPARLFARSAGSAGASTISLGDICQIAGGAVALGFGLWHFTIPATYGWQSYVPEAPQTLVDAVAATNFFMSLSLSLVGASNIVMPLLAESATPLGRYWLWANVGLWTTPGRVPAREAARESRSRAAMGNDRRLRPH